MKRWSSKKEEKGKSYRILWRDQLFFLCCSAEASGPRKYILVKNFGRQPEEPLTNSIRVDCFLFYNLLTRTYLSPPFPKGHNAKNEFYFLVQLNFYRLKAVSRYPLPLRHPPSVPPQKDYLPEGTLYDINEDLPNYSTIKYTYPHFFVNRKKPYFSYL